MAIIVRVVAETLATPVAGVDADGIRTEKVHIAHVSYEPLAREERTVAYLALEITREDVCSFVLDKRCAVKRPELAVAAVISALALRVLGTVKADVLAEVTVEYSAMWTVAL